MHLRRTGSLTGRRWRATVPELARLEVLRQSEEHAGGPGKGHETGDGDHSLEEPPVRRQIVLAAERRVVEEREVVRRAQVRHRALPAQEACPSVDLDQM